jgi:hypothetical protein
MTMAKVIDIERVFDDQKIGSFHIKLLLLSFLVLMTDGFDLGMPDQAFSKNGT